MFKRVLRSYHETISINDITADRDGYILAYLSNENQEAVNIHWDDFTVYHGKTNVVSTQDYYPFGLTFNESQRTGSKINFMNTFQDQEYEEETGWVKFKWRNHDPAIGRFFNVDPLAHDYVYNSPYAFQENKLGRGIELEGAELLQGAFTAKYMALKEVVKYKANQSRSAASSLVSGESGDRIPNSNDSGSGNSLSTKQISQLNDIGTISKNTTESTRLVANEVSKDAITVADATGTGLQLTPLKPLGSLISGLATIADESRQVAFEDKDAGDALTDVVIKGSINIATGKLGNVAKKGADKITGGTELNDKVVNTYETVINKTATEIYDESTEEKDK